MSNQSIPSFVKDDLIFMTLAGSNMYGTNTPDSDIDLRGVCIPPRNVVMGFARNFEQQTYENEDTVVYSLMKFMKLMAENNPNIIELLYAPEDCIRTITPTWEKLRERRDEFISAKCYHTFTGYSYNQLKRLKRRKAKRDEESNDRPSPKELKHAMHLIRLLRMGEEILTQGVVQVRRPDFADLLAIRNGEVPLEEVFAEADRRNANLDSIYKSKSYVVPHSSPKVELSDFCVDLHETYWRQSDSACGVCGYKGF